MQFFFSNFFEMVFEKVMLVRVSNVLQGYEWAIKLSEPGQSVDDRAGKTFYCSLKIYKKNLIR